MKIDKPAKPLPANLLAESAPHASARGRRTLSPAAQQSGQPVGISVSLGSTAAQLHNMESSMASSPVVDTAKVAEIKQAISEGRFKVNSGVVADRLIESVRDLIDSKV